MKIQRTIICTFLWSISFLGIIAQNDKYFVDMGIRADNGDVLLWANGDLASLKDGSFVILEQDQIGDTYGWGDITGKAVGTNLSLYGGVNPSVEISGNPSFDITTSKLGSEYRLPTYKEIERLVKNSRISTFKARRNLPAIDSYGVPTWIYGQWMWQGGGNWHSIKFDGPIANIISSDKGRITTTYEGAYKYKDGILYIGNLKLSADKERNVLSADNGGFFIKVSSQSDEAEIEYYVIESKINHNKLYFPLYRKTQHLSSNNGYMAVFDTPNRDRIGYWSGSLLTVEGKQGGIYLLMDSRYFQPQIDNRYEHYRIRPVKTVKGSERIERKKQQMEEEAKQLVEAKRLIEEQHIKQDEKEAEKNPLSKYSITGSCHNGLYIVSDEEIVLSNNGDPVLLHVYGVVNDGGIVYIPKEYEQLELIKEGSTYEDNVYKCKKKGKWGLVNSTNSTLLSCEYNNLTNIGNNIWRTSKSGKFGYVQLNTTSNVTTLIPCIYESLGDYSSDSYIHATLKGKKGMIDSKNKIIIPFEYSNVGNPCHTSNGYSIIWVEKDGKLGIYNDDGKELQPCDIDKAYILTEYNSIELSYTDCPSTDYIYIVRNGLTGLISGSTFETIIPCMYEYLSPIKTSKAFYKANGKWGIIDTSNKTIQLAIYDNVEIDGSTLSEQKMPSMAFQSNMYVRNNGKVGMLKANGEDFIPVKYDSLGMYSDNMLVAKVGDKYGFINEEGKESVPFVYSQAHNYSEGLAAVVNENGKYLFIDKLGNVAIKPKGYDRVDDFQNGTCKVYRKNKFWEIDREGKKVKNSTKKIEADNVHKDSSNDEMYVAKGNIVSPHEADTESEHPIRKKKKSILNILFGVEDEPNAPQSVNRTYQNRKVMRNRGEVLRYRQNTFGNKQERNWREAPKHKRKIFGNRQSPSRRRF